MRDRDFELVAAAIRGERRRLEADLDPSYSIAGSLALDRLTERLADDFASRYPRFKYRSFLSNSQLPQDSDRLADFAASSPSNGARTENTVKSEGSTGEAAAEGARVGEKTLGPIRPGMGNPAPGESSGCFPRIVDLNRLSRAASWNAAAARNASG
jgi:hypothetical protein